MVQHKPWRTTQNARSWIQCCVSEWVIHEFIKKSVPFPFSGYFNNSDKNGENHNYSTTWPSSEIFRVGYEFWFENWEVGYPRVLVGACAPPLTQLVKILARLPCFFSLSLLKCNFYSTPSVSSVTLLLSLQTMPFCEILCFSSLILFCAFNHLFCFFLAPKELYT